MSSRKACADDNCLNIDNIIIHHEPEWKALRHRHRTESISRFHFDGSSIVSTMKGKEGFLYGFITFPSFDGVLAFATSFLSDTGTASGFTGLDRTIKRVPVLYFIPPLTESWMTFIKSTQCFSSSRDMRA